MPELPEVETTMRALAARLTGRGITGVAQRRADLRYPLPADLVPRLVGRRVTRFSRRAKYIRFHLDDGTVMLLHLGMSGRLILDGPSLGVHEHLTFGFDDGSRLRFHDPRRFGMLDLVADAELDGHRWLRHLGLEPLTESFDGRALRARVEGRIAAIKVALMDQRIVVGIGNIYASESLHRAGIRPSRPAGAVAQARLERLACATREVLMEAITAGGSSLRDYVGADGVLGSFQNGFRVYGRAGEACPVCGGRIGRIVLGGRATYFCGRCQR